MKGLLRLADGRIVLIAVLLFAALLLKGVPAELPPVRAENPAGSFDAPRAAARLARILGDERPHPADTEAGDAVRARLIAEIEALGLDPVVREDVSCRTFGGAWTTCATIRNVAFRVGPAGGGALMVASHYDSVPAGPGASDDGLGVAVTLEVAAQFAADPPPKPVIFLVTDGEELGLLGARAFVERDPWAEDVQTVINIEARGVRGPALMFETSAPNGRDMSLYSRGADRPFANSLMSDIYRLMPNDTDMTDFFSLDIDALNIALLEGVEYYHTPKDNLANFSVESLQHAGDSALGGVRAFLDAESPAAGESQLAYADILSRGLVAAPQWLAAVLLGFGIVVAAASLRRSGPGRWRALAAPPAALIGAAGLAFGVQAAIGALRPETQFWFAQPIWLQSAAYLSAIFATLLAFRLIAKPSSAQALLASTWLWLGALSLGAFAVVPGASLLFALPLVIFAAIALAEMLSGRSLTPLHVLSALAAALVFAPALHFAELGLGLEMLPVPAAVACLIALAALPLGRARATPESWAPSGAALAALALVAVVAALAPAYAPTKPVMANLHHRESPQDNAAHWTLQTTDPGPPAPLAAAAPFASTELDYAGQWTLAAPAPRLGLAPPKLELLSDIATEAGRVVRFRLDPAGADEVAVAIPADADVRAIASGSARAEPEPGRRQSLRCVGRSCARMEFEVTLAGREPTDWRLQARRYGLPPEAAPLATARPDWATPMHDGDLTIVYARATL